MFNTIQTHFLFFFKFKIYLLVNLNLIYFGLMFKQQIVFILFGKIKDTLSVEAFTSYTRIYMYYHVVSIGATKVGRYWLLIKPSSLSRIGIFRKNLEFIDESKLYSVTKHLQQLHERIAYLIFGSRLVLMDFKSYILSLKNSIYSRLDISMIMLVCFVFYLFWLSSSCVLCVKCCQCLWIVHSW